MSGNYSSGTERVTTNPTECPACGSVGEQYNHGTQEFRCPNRDCGVNWFYRGETLTNSTLDPENYVRGADGRSRDAATEHGGSDE